MILVTGAAGKTGLAVLRRLSRRGVATRALVHRNDQIQIAKKAGASEAIIGDLLDASSLQTFSGIEAIYLICPNVHPQELEIGRAVIAAAKTSGNPRIVYHSVMYPQIKAMPHHWQKLRVEEALISSGLDFTILQPASYMQNVLPYWESIIDKGEYKVPYAVDALFTPVDLNDVAEVACLTLTDATHNGGIYQLAGPERMSSNDMAEIISSALGKRMRAIEEPLDEWIQAAKDRKMNSYAIDALTKMFDYYNEHGFTGSSVTLEKLLGRRAAAFMQVIAQFLG